MDNWFDITRSNQYKELSPEDRIAVKQRFFERFMLPKMDEDPDLADPNVKQATYIKFMQSPDDTGEGFFRSMAGAAARGFGEMVPGTVEGVGALTGIQPLREAGQAMREGLESIAPVNPIYAEGIPAQVANVAGNVGGIMATGGIGGAIGKGVAGAGRAAQAIQTGARSAVLGTGFAQGAAGKARENEQLGITGPEAYLNILGGGLAQTLPEVLPFGTALETAAARRLLGGADEAGRVIPGVRMSAAQEGVEGAASQVLSNISTQLAAPEGVQTPGIFEGVGEAALWESVGGGMFGVINKLGRTPPERQTPQQQQAAAEFNASPVDQKPDITPEESLQNAQQGGIPVVSPDGEVAWLPAMREAITQPAIQGPTQPSAVEQRLQAAISLAETAAANPAASQAAAAAAQVINEVAQTAPIETPPISEGAERNRAVIAEAAAKLRGQAPQEISAGLQAAIPPSLPETGLPPVVDQEAPAGTPVQAASIESIELPTDSSDAIKGIVKRHDSLFKNLRNAGVDIRLSRPSEAAETKGVFWVNETDEGKLELVLDEKNAEKTEAVGLTDQAIFHETVHAAQALFDRDNQFLSTQADKVFDPNSAEFDQELDSFMANEVPSWGKIRGTRNAKYEAVRALLEAKHLNKTSRSFRPGMPFVRYLSQFIEWAKANVFSFGTAKNKRFSLYVTKIDRLLNSILQAAPIQPVETQEDAIPQQIPDEGVLRQERPEMELQAVGEGNIQPEEVAREGEIQEGSIEKTTEELRSKLASMPQKADRDSEVGTLSINEANRAAEYGSLSREGRDLNNEYVIWANPFSEEAFAYRKSNGDVAYKAKLTDLQSKVEDWKKKASEARFIRQRTELRDRINEAKPAPQISRESKTTERVPLDGMLPPVDLGSPSSAAQEEVITPPGEPTTATEGMVTPGGVATERDLTKVEQINKFLSNLRFYGTAKMGGDQYTIKQASDDSFYIEKTTGGQRSVVASGFSDIEGAQQGAAELVSPTPEKTSATGQPTPAIEEALPERGASIETIASGGGMSIEEARQFLARKSDNGEPLIFGRPFSEISGMQQQERPRVLRTADKLRAIKQIVGDINKFKIPVSQEVVDTYGITLPEGYVKQGNLYIFQPQTTAAETQTPVPLREGTGAAGVVQSEPVEGSIPTVEQVSPETETTSTEKADVVSSVDRLMESNASSEEMDRFVKTLTDDQFNELVRSEGYDVDPKLTIKPKDSYDAKRMKRRELVNQLRKEVVANQRIAKTAQQVIQQEEVEAKKQLAGEEMRSKALDSIIGNAEKKDREFGQVQVADAAQAMAMLQNSGEVPGVLTAWVGNSKDFLADPQNEQIDPEVYNRVKRSGPDEGLFNKGRVYIFLDGIGVSEKDRLRGENLNISPQVAAVRRVLLHESLVHKGIHGLPLRHRRLILNWVKQNATPEDLDKLAELYTEYRNWRTSTFQFEALAEEYLAKQVDQLTELPKDGPMARLMDILRQIWEYIVGYKKEPTLTDLKSVVKLLKSGAQAVANDRLKDGGGVKLSIRAYHGTPHKVDKFSLSKIGTGEGAQAYGWGLYFAENRAVASKYVNAGREGATGFRIKGEQLTGNENDSEMIRRFDLSLDQIKAVRRMLEAIPADLQDLDEYIAELKQKSDDLEDTPEGDEAYSDFIDLSNLRKDITVDSNNLYTVELLPDADEFLDWDKPLSEQKNPKLAALKKQHRAFLQDPAQRISDKGKNGDSLYHMVTRQKGSEKAASEYLASLGIPGIRYLDGGSRGAGDGTRNYVIFDENLVRILEENGQSLTPPEGSDIRFSKVDFSTPSDALLNTGSEVSRDTLYDSRIIGIRNAIRQAYEAMPKTNSVAVPIGELLSKTQEFAPDVTAYEFSNVLQDMFEDNGAVLQEGDVVESLTEQDRRYLALAEDEDANREELHRMVDEAATRRIGLPIKDASEIQTEAARATNDFSKQIEFFQRKLDTELSPEREMAAITEARANREKWVEAGLNTDSNDPKSFLAALDAGLSPVKSDEDVKRSFEIERTSSLKEIQKYAIMRERFSGKQTSTQFATGSGFIARMYHATPFGRLTTFDAGKLGTLTGAPSATKAHFFAGDPKVSETYFGDDALYLKHKGFLSLTGSQKKELVDAIRDEFGDLDSASNQDVANTALALFDEIDSYDTSPIDNVLHEVYVSMKNPLVFDFKGSGYREQSFSDLIDKAIENGHDGVVFANTYDAGPAATIDDKGPSTNVFAVIAGNESQIKSADPVTRDDQGRIIPLSRRFDTGADIRGQINVTTPEGKRAGFVVVMPSQSPSVESMLRGMASGQPAQQPINQDKYDTTLALISDFTTGKRTIKFPRKLAPATGARTGDVAAYSQIAGRAGEAATVAPDQAGVAGAAARDGEVPASAGQVFDPYSVRDFVETAARIGVDDVRIDPSTQYGASALASQDGVIQIRLNPERMAESIARSDGDSEEILGSALNEELIHAADLVAARTQWNETNRRQSFDEFVKDQDIKTVNEIIQVARSSNNPEETTRVLFDAISSSINLYGGTDITSLDAVENFLKASDHDTVSAVMGEFVRQMIQSGLYQTVSEASLFRRFIDRVKQLVRRIAAAFAPAKGGQYGELIRSRLNEIEDILDFASRNTGIKASKVDPENAAAKRLKEDADAASAGSVRANFGGVPFVDYEGTSHITKTKKSYEEAAVRFVDDLVNQGISIDDIADSIMSPAFLERVGIKDDLAMINSVVFETRNRIVNTMRKTRDAALRKRLERKHDDISAFSQGVRSTQGQNFALLQQLMQSPRYRWQFIYEMARKQQKQDVQNVVAQNVTNPDELKDGVDADAQASADAATEQNVQAAENATGTQEDVDDDADLRAGEATLNEENKSLWNKVKDWLREIGAAMNHIKSMDGSSKASLSAAQRSDISKMSREEALAFIEDRQKKINKALKTILGEESEAKTPEQKATRQKRKKMVDVAKKRAEKGKPVDPAEILESDDPVSKMIREMSKARPGQTPPLKKQIPWRTILSQKASTVAEYRQRIFDVVSSNEAFANLTDEQKQRFADVFAQAWEQNRTRILDSMLENRIRQERARNNLTKAGAEALQKQRMKLVEDLNLGILDNEQLMIRLAEKFGIKAEYTEQEREQIDNLLDILQDENTNAALRASTASKLLSILSDVTKVPIAKIIADFWVTSVLSGFNTIFSIGAAVASGAFELLSGFSRVIRTGFRNPQEVPGAIIDSFKAFRNMLAAFPMAARSSWQYLVTGDRLFLDPSMNDITKDLNYEQIGRTTALAENLAKSENKLAKMVGLYMRTVSRLLTALDNFNSTSTKFGSLPIVFRSLKLTPEKLAQIQEKNNLQMYIERVIRNDFNGVQPKNMNERATVEAYARAEMMKDLDELGRVSENADFYGMQGAMTLDPTGIGGAIYKGLRDFTGGMSKSADNYIAAAKRRWQIKEDPVLDFINLASAYFMQFIAYNASNMAGFRFARFAGNKFNQGLSFIPGIGMLRKFEADSEKNPIRGKEAFIDMIDRNQMAGMALAVIGYVLLEAIADEPDDEKRGWAINGGWGNLTPEKKKQLLAAGMKEYTIRIGDKVYNYINWPISSALAAIGGLSDLIRFSPEAWDEKDVVSRLGTAAASGIFAATDIPALSTVQELFGSNLSSKDPVANKLDRLARVMSGYAGGFVPRILKDFDYLAEPGLRKYKTLWEKTASHIPVYRRHVGEEYYDILGRQIERKVYPGSREFLAQPTEPEYRILGALNSRGIWLTPANAEHRMVGRGSRKRNLTQEEADAYSLETGRGYRQMLLKYGQRALRMPPERAQAFLQDLADDVRDRALMRVYRGYRPAE